MSRPTYPLATRRLQEAAKVARSAGDEELLAEISNRQGVVAVGNKDFELADRLIQSALDYANAHSVSWLAISAMGNLGLPTNECPAL